jgi:hypothetical protein
VVGAGSSVGIEPGPAAPMLPCSLTSVARYIDFVRDGRSNGTTHTQATRYPLWWRGRTSTRIRLYTNLSVRIPDSILELVEA